MTRKGTSFVLEILAAEAVVVACHGASGALDRQSTGLPSVIRIAPDEAWVVGPRARRAAVVAAATAWLAAADPDGVAVDQTDGWAIWAVRGERRDDLFGRLSVSPMPAQRPALVQGALSGVAGKVVFTRHATYYMVPSPAGHHLRDRILEAGDDLRPELVPPQPFEAVLGRMALGGGVPAGRGA